MLDTDTKRRIDTARDILVGKVPDPKSQVEQITIALIYKFMDDMDADAEEMGGKRKFFAKAYARYGWSKLMQPGLGGHEMLNLYAEGIQKMPENPGIPPLFREIFKNAFLPYRDPETLKGFLKIIDEFSYDHSERLGDAFEYLLSVLGSQGDAGQFRTPRHIIDFIVAIVDPKKNETVLDPACGTAGFLISSYKHIRRANTDARGHSTLTPDERARLAANFTGYDISPDMVRLSLVNLYLHGFPDPHIAEYDTLTSLERWNEHADVILANPPFMSPKGGIRPHNRFGVQSKRSEVLFVDYMAEHLTPNGRAGIIVPEGIIFQSQTAYKQLRKLLVEDSLVAVVSLPAGVFNPYAGVKTSVLVLDKSLAKRAQTIAFFKIINDGFNLGAQRRPIDKDDLPQALAEIDEYLRRLRAGESVEDFSPSLGLIVPKEKIAANGDYNLSGERYCQPSASVAGEWPLVPLGDVTRRISGGTPSKRHAVSWRGTIPWVSPKDMKQEVLHDTEDHVSPAAVESSATNLVPANTLLCVVRSGILKHSLPLAITAREMCFNQDILALIPADDRLDARYLFWLLKARSAAILETGIKPGVTVQSFYSGFFSRFEIPLPPLEVQKGIVAEIEGYQKVIDGARAVLDNYRPHITIDPDWPMVELGEVVDELESGVSVNSTNRTSRGHEFGVLKTSCVTSGVFDAEEHKAVLPAEVARLRCPVRGNAIIVSRMNTEALVGANAYVPRDYPNLFLPDRLWQTVVSRNDVEVRYLQVVLASPDYRSQISALCGGTSGSMKNISKRNLLSLEIPLPPLDVQRAIVAEIEAEQALVNANRELVARMEKKIQATLARVWGEGSAPRGKENQQAA